MYLQINFSLYSNLQLSNQPNYCFLFRYVFDISKNRILFHEFQPTTRVAFIEMLIKLSVIESSALKESQNKTLK